MSLINVDNVNKSTDRPTLKQAEAATICRIRAALTAAAAPCTPPDIYLHLHLWEGAAYAPALYSHVTVYSRIYMCI